MNQENNTPEDNINTRHLRRMQRKRVDGSKDRRRTA